MSTEENKALTRRFWEEAFNQGNLATVDELCAPTFLYHDPSGPIQGPEGFKQFLTMYRTAFPDAHVTIEDLIAEGDEAVIRVTYHGTNTGSFMGISPTGKTVNVSGISITRLIGGKAVESWANYDALGMLQQMGVVPTPG